MLRLDGVIEFTAYTEEFLCYRNHACVDGHALITRLADSVCNLIHGQFLFMYYTSGPSAVLCCCLYQHIACSDVLQVYSESLLLLLMDGMPVMTVKLHQLPWVEAPLNTISAMQRASAQF